MASMAGTEIPLRDLLAPPAFKREHFAAHLYSPFSIKLFRRVYIYGHAKFDLWVRLESDPSIQNFNERVQPIPIAFSNGKASNLSPSFISVDTNKKVKVHLICYEDEQSETQKLEIDGWTKYCEQREFTLEPWSIKALQENPIELGNLKRLLRFTSDETEQSEYCLSS